MVVRFHHIQTFNMTIIKVSEGKWHDSRAIPGNVIMDQSCKHRV